LQNELAAAPVHISEDRRHVLGADSVEVQVQQTVACSVSGCRSVWGVPRGTSRDAGGRDFRP